MKLDRTTVHLRQVLLQVQDCCKRCCQCSIQPQVSTPAQAMQQL